MSSTIPVGAITAEARDVWPELVRLRRTIHRNPELAGSERETSALVAESLRRAGLEVRTSVGGHGVVALLRGARPAPVVVYRADLDAVPAAEAAASEYQSVRADAAHLCGHDVHVAVGVGIARILSALRAELPGSVVFLFQPAEETLEGARAVIDSGALSEFAPSGFFAFHTFPLEVGTLGVAPGAGFASCDHVEVHLGQESTQEAADAIEAALFGLGHFEYPESSEAFAQLMAELEEGGRLQRFIHVERWPDARENGDLVLTFGLRASGLSVPEVRSRATAVLAALEPDPIRHKQFRTHPVPSLASDASLSHAAAAAAAPIVGSDHLRRIRGTVPFNSEDFALYGSLGPAAMLLLGVANSSQGIRGIPHEPDFDVDETSIGTGAAAMSAVLWGALASQR